MSYQDIFWGHIYPFEFNSRDGDRLDENVIDKYLPKEFLIHPYTKEKVGYKLKYHIQVYNDNNFGVGFYLTKTDEDYGKDIKLNLEKCSSQIQIHIDHSPIDIDENELTIKWLDTKFSERGKGLAKYLLLLANLYCSFYSEDVIYTKLDDDSDNYANGIENPKERREKQKKNIYCKVGYKYEDESGGPEMKAKVSNILRINGLINKEKHELSSIETEYTHKEKRQRVLKAASKKKKKKSRKHTKLKKKRKSKQKRNKSKMR